MQTLHIRTAVLYSLARQNVVSTRDDRYREFLERLRQARMRTGLTQDEAARALGKPQSYISRCESGERRVDVVELSDLAALYQVDVQDLMPTWREEYANREP